MQTEIRNGSVRYKFYLLVLMIRNTVALESREEHVHFLLF